MASCRNCYNDSEGRASTAGHSTLCVEVPCQPTAMSGVAHPFAGAGGGSLFEYKVATLLAADLIRSRHTEHGGVWVPETLTRGYALHPGARNRYMMRYTRTQHRPA